MRDYASSIELTILSNLEFYNAIMIKDGINQQKRLVSLNIEANKEKEILIIIMQKKYTVAKTYCKIIN